MGSLGRRTHRPALPHRSTRRWVIGYTLWNWTFVYLNYPGLMGHHTAVLSAGLIVALYAPLRWSQTRASTLGFSLLGSATWFNGMIDWMDTSTWFDQRLPWSWRTRPRFHGRLHHSALLAEIAELLPQFSLPWPLGGHTTIRSTTMSLTAH